jgi:hypothetical protein
MKRGVILLAATCLLASGCGKKEEPKDFVAKIGSRTIDWKELKRSYVLQPQWERGQTEFQSYLTQLHDLATEKLYAQEAEKLGIDRDSLITRYLEFTRQKETIKGLYRKEILKNVMISDAEAREVYEWMKKKLDYEYVASPDSAQCALYAKQLAGKRVEQVMFPPDSSVRGGREAGATVGSVPPELERTMFTGGVDEVYGPVKAGGIYMAVKVTDALVEKFFSENEFAAQREKINSLLTNKKADSLASRYVYTIMKDTDLRLNAPVFWGVADYFFQRVKEDRRDPRMINNINVTSDELRILEGDLQSMADATIATHREGKLTVRELVAALSDMPGSLRPRVRTPQNLKDAIGGVVRNQYLLKEAARQGLDKDPDVLYEYGLQRDETLAAAYYERRRSHVNVTPDEVQALKTLAPVSENQVFFKFNMTALARDAKTDSVLRAELPGLTAQYGVVVDSAKVRATLKTPDAILNEKPMRIFVREIFM